MARATQTLTTFGPSVRTIKNGRDSVQLVPAHEFLVIDTTVQRHQELTGGSLPCRPTTTAQRYDVTGCRHMERAALNLSIPAARELVVALQDVIDRPWRLITQTKPDSGRKKLSAKSRGMRRCG